MLKDPPTVLPFLLPFEPRLNSIAFKLAASTYEVIGSILSVHAPNIFIPSMVTFIWPPEKEFKTGSIAKAPRLITETPLSLLLILSILDTLET